MTTIDREKLKKLQEREAKRFVAEHPRSAELYKRAQQSLLGGVSDELDEEVGRRISGFVTKSEKARTSLAPTEKSTWICASATPAR